MSRILLLTGPGGSGKTTIAERIAQKHDYIYLDGDHEDTEFFPQGGQRDPANAVLMTKAHKKILRLAKAHYDQGKNVVVDYIIFGQFREFIESFRGEFGEDFTVKVLFPSQEECIRRDAERECWTAGEENIAQTTHDLLAIKDVIGDENFVDSTEMSSEETISHLIAL